MMSVLGWEARRTSIVWLVASCSAIRTTPSAVLVVTSTSVGSSIVIVNGSADASTPSETHIVPW